MNEIGDGWSGNQNQIKESIELVLNTIEKVLKENQI